MLFSPEDVIKSFELCASVELKCKNCKYEGMAFCDCKLKQDVLELINVEHLDKQEKSGAAKDDPVNHPSHYTSGMECIDEMIMVFGKQQTMSFCLLNAWKYRKRAIFKNGEEDIKKSDWYLAKYKELIGSIKDDFVKGMKLYAD